MLHVRFGRAARAQLPFLLFEWLALREQIWLVQFLRLLWLVPAVALYPLLVVRGLAAAVVVAAAAGGAAGVCGSAGGALYG